MFLLFVQQTARVKVRYVEYSTSQPQGQPRTVEKGARRREEEMHPLLIQQSGKIAGQIITLRLGQSGKISGHLTISHH